MPKITKLCLLHTQGSQHTQSTKFKDFQGPKFAVFKHQNYG